MEEGLIKQKIKEETEKLFLKTPLVSSNPPTVTIAYPYSPSTSTLFPGFASGKEVQDLHILVLEQAEQIRVLTEAVNTLLDNKIQDFNKKKDE